ncbi:hypothetical protein EVJ58_g3521 [Rhodofomes roseus]|uniref:Inner centromere protein ARK-binding domain-containing protein n=1 Tax=Rhodofomes roseus TaxID=34475 RepID=A0A4Y9YPK5_9APHY|nr:hypothetical protein EVJ58_g3521 [Rhodofomes roseus]
MDRSTPGGAGVLKFCNDIRLSMAKDPGRQLLHDRIQDTMDFLDDYLEKILEGPSTESMTELLKTPGRRKNAHTRTRSTTATAARKEAVIAMTLDQQATDHGGNHAPVNSFHKALLQAKKGDDEEQTDNVPRSNESQQRIPHASSRPDVAETATSKPVAQASAGVRFEQAQDRVEERGTEEVNVSGAPTEQVATELSIIAEDDEPADRSRLSLLPPSSGAENAQMPQLEVLKVEEPNHASDALTSMDVDEPAQTETMSTTDTFHSISLDSPPSHRHITPAPKDPSPVADEPQEAQEPIPIVPSTTADDELSVPLRDEPSSATLDGKPIIGLPAPSPLHKSARTGREPSMGTALGPGGKRGSWLVKAREVKAMEIAGKRASSTLGTGLGLGVLGAKRKSGEMMEFGGAVAGPSRSADDGERMMKAAKLSEDGDSAQKGKMRLISVEEPPSLSPKPHVEMKIRAATVPPEDFTTEMQVTNQDEPLLDTFKKRLEGFGARHGKSMGKSLGGTAAAALAEARAAAEARVAERNKLERGSDVGVAPDASEANDGVDSAELVLAPAPTEHAPVSDSQKRLSMSDLLGPSMKEPSPLSGREPPLPALNIQAASANADTSVSTTPPNSPPPRPAPMAPPAGPVFSKPPTVFAPPPASTSAAQSSKAQPAAGSSKEFSFKMPSGNPFSMPAAMTLGVPASLGSPNSQKTGGGLSAQSSKASVFSDTIFDKEDSIPAWMPHTQDTEYSMQPSQSQQKFDDTDDDDSWHVDDKFAPHQIWTPFGFTSGENRDDTWSTLPSRSTSQKGGDTGFVTTNFTNAFVAKKDVEQVDEAPPEAGMQPSSAIPAVFDFEQEQVEQEQDIAEQDIADEAMEIDEIVEDEDMELEDIVNAGQSTVSLVQPKQPGMERSQSQQSMASTASSSQQSQVGLFGQASKFVSSMLGGSKKPVKSLQLAAQAAKKQQEEIEKKATRMKEMENRRQLVQQRKAEEEQARAQEEERKIREENERRKKEREEHTDKRPLSRMASKKQLDDDNTKKRKLEAEKKPVESKKPPSKDKKDVPAAPRVMVKPGPSTTTHPPGTKIGPPPKSAMKQTDLSDPKATTMADRAKAQIQAQQPPPMASEAIELPDINSEYSDSDDEDRPRTFDPPDWAQSPELITALQQQAAVNPDEVFGRIPPLRMEDMFRTRQSRFRARTSSANWSGPDGLTAEEEREYARRMGFK